MHVPNSNAVGQQLINYTVNRPKYVPWTCAAEEQMLKGHKSIRANETVAGKSVSSLARGLLAADFQPVGDKPQTWIGGGRALSLRVCSSHLDAANHETTCMPCQTFANRLQLKSTNILNHFIDQRESNRCNACNWRLANCHQFCVGDGGRRRTTGALTTITAR